jgi:hypothetical protein
MAQSVPTFDADSLRTVLMDRWTRTQEPGGFVILNYACGARGVVTKTTDPENIRPLTFEDITKSGSGYQIDRESAVMNILPENYEPEILKAKIREFVLDSDKSSSLAFQELLQLKELHDFVEAAQLNKGLQIIIGPRGPKPDTARRIELISNISLREALNAMAVFYRNGIWGFTEDRCYEKPQSHLFINASF